MPTTRPRHLVTETDQIARALDDAARHWPRDRASRAKLLVHLVEQGHRAMLEEERGEQERRVDAVKRTSGALTGSYGPRYRAELREEWPE